MKPTKTRRLYVPDLNLLERLVKELHRTYPEDAIVPMSDLNAVLEAAYWCMTRRRGDKALWLAAALIYYIVNGHPLVDGNKRLAMLITNETLKNNGYFVPGRHLESACLRVATGTLTLKGVYKWLVRKAKRLEEQPS